MLAYIKSASDPNADPLGDIMDTVEDDFDFIISGLEKLGREKSTQGQALTIASNMADGFQSIIKDIASALKGERVNETE